MEHEAALIVEVAQGSALERRLREYPPVGGGRGQIVIVGLAAEDGRLDALRAGEVVLSVPSPEALTADPQVVKRVVDLAPAGTEPLVIAVEEAEELGAEELRLLLEAAGHARRPVILRVMHAS